MEFQVAEADCVDSAKRDVASQLNKPESLERLEEYKRKITRKKGSIESQLRNAVQTQLDGVQTGLHTLQELENLVKEVREGVSDVEKLYSECAELSDVVRPIREVNRKHHQLRTTTIHINNIFNVPTVVKETHELIEKGQLLEAHRNLAELEHTRDELFIQLYRSEDSFVDKNTSLHHYFESLLSLSDSLGQQLWLVIGRMTCLIATEPSKVVTAFRIVEREEKTDAMIAGVLSSRKIPVTQLPGRPKKWKEKCMEEMKTSISNRFQELEPSEADKMENKEWLHEYLSEVAKYSYTEIQEMKEKGVMCFPPSYDILGTFIKLHHFNLTKMISSMVSEDPNARDIIPLMIWIGDIRDSFLETLDVDLVSHGRLIDPKTEVKLQGRCQKQVESNMMALVGKMVETEGVEICGFQGPETDMDNHYYTMVGITLFQMVDQNIAVLSPLGLKNKCIILSICQSAIIRFQQLYRNTIEDCRRKHLESRKREPPYYINHLIAAANSCRSSVDFNDQLKQRFKIETNQTTLSVDHERNFKDITEEFESIAHLCCDCVVQSTLIDMVPVFAELFQKDTWFNHPGEPMGKVEATLHDYNSDFKYLKQAYHSYVIIEIQHQTVHAYMQAFLSKRMVFKKDKEREKATSLVKDDTMKMSNCFLRLSHATNPKCTQVVEEMANLLCANQEYLALDIAGMANKHPDIRINHVVAVLAMRGDLNRGLVQKIVQQTTLREQQEETPLSSRCSSASSNSLEGGIGMKKKLGEKMLFQSILVPNPYSMVAK